MKLLIDGDGPLYRAAAAAQRNWYYVYMDGHEDKGHVAHFRYHKEAKAWMGDSEEWLLKAVPEVDPPYAAIHNIKSIMEGILDRGLGDNYALYLGGEGNYRYLINPEYKAGRPPRPTHYEIVKDYMIGHYGAEIVNGMESDDACSIAQWQDFLNNDEPTTILVSNDKDLDMVPGYHYNWLTQDQYFITEEQGDLNFYMQLLMGDKAVDNIQGLHGVGPVTARQILADATNSSERYAACVAAYEERGRTDIEDIARQIWMSKEQPDDWRKPE